MSDPTDKTPRGVTNLRIKFRSANLDEFIERYAVDVSRGGIFIRTREPLSVGSRLKLDFQLLDAAPLLDGEGTVVWIRQPDPARAEVTPGMGVRFDKLSDDSQQRLDKILAEKDRLGQAGKAPGMTKTGAGIAVRRPTGAFAPLDTSAAKAPPPVEVKTGPVDIRAADVKPAPADAPRPSGGFSTLGRPTAGFGRPRSMTGGHAPLRSAPVPSSLFEPPTSDDIDKALSVLEEKSGPIPAMPPPPRLVPSAPIAVSDEISNEPTRVVSDPQELAAHQAVTATRNAVVPENGAPEAPVNPVDDRTTRAEVQEEEGKEEEIDEVEEAEEIDEATMAASPAAFAAAEKAISGGVGTPDRKPSEAPVAMPVGGATATAGVPRKKSIVVEPASPVESGRFRTDATYRRPRKGAKRVAVLVVLAAAGGAGYAFRARLGALFPAKENASVTAPATPSPEPKSAVVADAAAADGAAATATAPAPTGDEKPAPSVAAPKDEKPAPEAAKPAETSKAAAKPAAEEPRPRKKKARAAQGAAAASAEAAAPGAVAAEGEKKPAAEGESAPPPSGGAAETPPPAAAATPILRIVSSPSGAEVLIDGTSVGKTPLAIQGVDPSASHALTFKKDGYEAMDRAVGTGEWSQGKSGPTAKVNVKLKRAAPAADGAKDEAKKDNKPDVEIITPD